MNQKLFDYLSDHDFYPLESDVQEITYIVLEETGFQWITVSDRLPDESGYYTVTMKGKIIEYYINVVYFDREHKTWKYYEYEDTVLAWMPLKPYDPIP